MTSMSEETPLPPVPSPEPQTPAVPAGQQMSNALGIWALVLSFTACCTLLGLILGIIGICKYPAGSAGRTLSIIATVIAVLIYSGGYIFQEPLLRISTQGNM